MYIYIGISYILYKTDGRSVKWFKVINFMYEILNKLFLK